MSLALLTLGALAAHTAKSRAGRHAVGSAYDDGFADGAARDMSRYSNQPQAYYKGWKDGAAEPSTFVEGGGLHMLGAVSLEEVGASAAGPYGDLYGGLLSTAGTLAQGAVNVADDTDTKNKASASDQAKLMAVILADTAAANAIANSLTSDVLAAGATGKAKSDAASKASSAQTAMKSALAAEATAAAALPDSQVAARIKAINDASASASAKAQKDPSNPFTQNLVKACQKVATMAQNAQIAQGADGVKSELTEEGFFQKKIFGVPTYAVAGVGLAGLLWLAVKKGLFSKLVG
jgi:hypothetical protein